MTCPLTELAAEYVATVSPRAHVLDSVSATLPSLVGREHEAIARLVAAGPPEVEVGLAPFGGAR